MRRWWHNSRLSSRRYAPVKREFLERLSHDTEQLQPGPVQARARALVAAERGRARRRRQEVDQPLRQQLPGPRQSRRRCAKPRGCALDRYGYGMASVRFICGTQAIHKELEERLSRFLGTEDTILYSSCFDANGGLFETLLDEQDAVISDALNHASIIDGVRLCKAQRFRYANNDLDELEDAPEGSEHSAACA